MATAARKAPQDRKPKATATADDAPKDTFSFELDGVTYTSTKGIAECVDFGVIRRYGESELFFFAHIIERLFDGNPDALAALDRLSPVAPELIEITRALNAQMAVSVGESARSSA